MSQEDTYTSRDSYDSAETESESLNSSDGRALNVSYVSSVEHLDEIGSNSIKLRYKKEFIEEERIGKGGFGKVYKAQHKLDQKYYAVKKIKVPKKSESMLREIKALARLNNPNVVQYHHSWFGEEFQEVLQKNIPSTCMQKIRDISMYLEESEEEEDDSSDESDDISDLVSSDGSSEDTEEEQDEVEADGDAAFAQTQTQRSTFDTDKIAEKEEDGGGDDSHLHEDGDEDGDEEEEHHEVENYMRRTELHRIWKSCFSYLSDLNKPFSVYDCFYNRKQRRFFKVCPYLYIQMELCYSTLREWLTKRNNKVAPTKDQLDLVNERTNRNFYRQVLKGMVYIHSQGILHRDLTPKNLFLSHQKGGPMHVKIGDFGLAREDVLMFQQDQDSQDPSACPVFTSNIGTVTYAAPEQLDGTAYDNKADMYSLGLILFELYHPFCTDMERYKSLDNLRKGSIPEELRNRWPSQCSAIQCLTSQDSRERPSASDLLAGDMFPSKNKMIEDQADEIKRLRNLLAEKEGENAQLKKVIAEKEAEIIQLKSRSPKM